jgi:hypothetical protein
MNSMLLLLDPSSSKPVLALLPRDSMHKEIAQRVSADANVRGALQALLEAGAADCAVRLLARVLPKKYAIAWACECVKPLLGAGSSNVDRAGVSLAERWLTKPTEENRRAALEFAEHGEFSGIGAWIAASAGWCEGSLAPKDLPEVRGPDSLTGDAVGAALLTAAAAVPSARLARLEGFVTSALKSFGQSQAGAA